MLNRVSMANAELSSLVEALRTAPDHQCGDILKAIRSSDSLDEAVLRGIGAVMHLWQASGVTGGSSNSGRPSPRGGVTSISGSSGYSSSGAMSGSMGPGKSRQ